MRRGRALRRRYGRAAPPQIRWRPNKYDSGAWAVIGPRNSTRGYFLEAHPAGDGFWWWKVEQGGRVRGSGERALSLQSAKTAAELEVALAKLKLQREGGR